MSYKQNVEAELFAMIFALTMAGLVGGGLCWILVFAINGLAQ